MVIFFRVILAVAASGFWLIMLDEILAWILVWLMLMFLGMFWSCGMSERICWLVCVLRLRSEVVDSHHVLEFGSVHVPVRFRFMGAWLAVVVSFRLYCRSVWWISRFVFSMKWFSQRADWIPR